MGLLEKLRLTHPTTEQRSDDDYVDLGDSQLDTPVKTGTQVHFSEVKGQQDTMKIKDMLYEGDIVIIDLKYTDSAGMNKEYVVEQLKKVVNEVDGDIAAQGEDEQIVVTPNGISISRQKL